MKIESFVSGGVAPQSMPQADKAIQQKAASEVEQSARRVSNEARTDVDSEDVLNDEMLDNAVKQANKTLEVYNKYIERSVHEKTHTIMYVLRDTETKEIIREFPPRKIQDMIAKMWELAGLLVDERR